MSDFKVLERRLEAQVKRMELALADVRAQLVAVREIIAKSPELPMAKGK